MTRTDCSILAWVAALLVAAVPSSHAETELSEVLGFDTPTGNVMFRARWNPDAGLSLRIAQRDREAAILVKLRRSRGTMTPVPASAFPRALRDGSRFQLESLPAEPLDDAEVILKVRSEMWSIYLQGRPVAAFPAPFLPPGDLSMPASQLPASGDTGARYQKIEDFVFHDDFLVPEEDENQLAAWEIDSGTWRLHTLLDHITPQDKLRGGKGLTAQHSPNFYSLHGSGTNAVITTGHYFYDTFTYESALQVMPGEAGLVFMFRDSDDYFTFTAEPRPGVGETRLRLKQVSPGKDTPALLAAADTDLGREQWVKLKVRTYFNRIECYMDNLKVFDVRHELPDGGLLGLFVNGGEGTRFDDVDAASNHDLDLGDIHELRYHTIAEQGRIFPRGPLSGLFVPSREWDSLRIRSTDEPQWIIVGSQAHAPHVFSAEIQSQGTTGTPGLIAGYTGQGNPYYRFTRRDSGREVAYRLETVSPGKAEIVAELNRPARASRVRNTWRTLMLDASNPRELRMYDNGTLVLVHHPAQDPVGASGIYAGPDTAAVVRDVRYHFERDDLHRNQFEKHRVFAEDKFMRHWSSPEGEWITLADKTTWHKSDFFGRFSIRMPLVEGSQVDLGVEEGRTDGALRVIANADAVRFAVPGAGDGEFRVIADAPADRIKSPDGKVKLYTIHHEGYWTWITSGNELLLSHAAPELMRGRRVRASGFSVAQLMHSLTEIYNVKDYLFTESLHDWTINGGRWEVVNRFQCDPRWSNLNGQSRSGVASLWSKYEFSGDFCVEMYAGTRHGWYTRPGDLNLTVHSRSGSPGDGYTVTCSGWDFDHSQLYTRLYRNGETFTESDKYLVPRIREGNKRQGFTPLIADGRPVHGAWYYLKFRRVGERLEYYFDNELVFAVDDYEPVPSGSIGLWTYLNSMVIARAKIAAEGIRPAARSVRPVDPAEEDSVELAGHALGDGGLVMRGKAVDLLRSDQWDSTMDAGRALIDWHTDTQTNRYFVLRNTLGGGSMAALADLRPIKLKDFAGFEFDIKRSADARFNFYFEVGTMSSSNTFVSARKYFHQISGSETRDAKHASAGSTHVEPVLKNGQRWHDHGDWQPVRVWIPEAEMKHRTNKKLFVRIAGFGNLQPSFVAQGLHGNGPHAAYAVRRLREIHYQAPAFGMAKSGTMSPPYTIRPADGSTPKTFESLQELNQWAGEQHYPAVQRHALEYASSNGTHRVPIGWIHLPESMTVFAEWATNRPGAFLVRHDGSYPDPRFVTGRLGFGSHSVLLEPGPDYSRIGMIPRKSPFTVAETPELKGLFHAGSERYDITLAWADRPLADRPAAISFADDALVLENFEGHGRPKGIAVGHVRARMLHDDPLQGRALEIRNFGAAHRLQATINRPVDLARYPVCQFRYRAPHLGRISLALGKRIVHLSEDRTGFNLGRSLLLDNEWHTWHGRVSRAPLNADFSPQYFVSPNVHFGSKHKVDQSGLYTRWSLDDLVFGPAVREGSQLAMTPNFFDPDGVASVSMAILSNALPAAERPADVLDALAWRDVPNGQPVTPDISGLPDGRHHVLFKAVDQAGLASTVTDIPFLIDREAPRRNYRFDEESKAYSNNGQVALLFFQRSGAPLDYSRLSVKWGEHPVALPVDQSTFTHSLDKDALMLTWAHTFRDHLRSSTDGMTNWLTVSGIQDGAGNAAQPMRVPFVVDYSKDRTPPTFLATTYPSNVLWSTGYENATLTKPTFAVSGKGATATLVRTNGPLHYTRFAAKKGLEEASLSQAFPRTASWRPGTHPFLAMRLRRPVVSATDTTNMELIFNAGKKVNYRIHLSGPSPHEDALRLPEDVTWKAGEWQSVILDLRHILTANADDHSLEDLIGQVSRKKAASNKDGEMIRILLKRPIASFSLRQSGNKHLMPLDIESMFVMREWQESDRIHFDAYDASGVAAVKWWIENESDALSVTPAKSGGDVRKSDWITVVVRDRAGNSASPFRIPVPGGTVPELRSSRDTAALDATPKKQGG